MKGLRWHDVSLKECREAARLGRDLMAKGHSLPISDLMVAAVALSRDLQVYSIDPHFDLIPNLRHFVNQ